MSYRSSIFIASVLLSLLTLSSCKEKGMQSVCILETTDLHGVILPYDFIEKKDLDASLAGSSTFIKKMREEKNALILLDNGDNLQGQPAVYYYNFYDNDSIKNAGTADIRTG